MEYLKKINKELHLELMHVKSENFHLRSDLAEEINSHAETRAKASLKLLKSERRNLILIRRNEELRQELLDAPDNDMGSNATPPRSRSPTIPSNQYRTEDNYTTSPRPRSPTSPSYQPRTERNIADSISSARSSNLPDYEE